MKPPVRGGQGPYKDCRATDDDDDDDDDGTKQSSGRIMYKVSDFLSVYRCKINGLQRSRLIYLFIIESQIFSGKGNSLVQSALRQVE
jgi:hypothetical protein